jgi:hypothetical protein
LNYSPHGTAALQAAINAGQGAATSILSSAFPAPREPTILRDADAAAVSLLWRIRANVHAAAPAIVQFVPCSTDGTSAAVAHAFARAAAAAIGRTLLLNVQQVTTTGPLPDAYISRLYHQSVSCNALLSLLVPQPGGACVAGGMFNVIVLDQSSPLGDGGACATAPLCTGTILVVDAGATDLAEIKSAVGRIVSLGGTVLGAVLAGVPISAMVE